MKKPSISLPRGFKGVLSKKTILSLPPGLTYRAITLLSSAYPEKTISSNTRLSVLYSLWLSQRKSEGKLLKESEKMMADIQRLHYFEVQKGLGKPTGEKSSRRNPPLRGRQLLAASSSRLHEKLATLGITDRNTLHRLEKTIGAEELESRVDSALDTFKGRGPIAQRIFSGKPELLVQNEDGFFDSLDGFKVRMSTIDRIRQKAEEKNLHMPSEFEYIDKPEILLNDNFLYRLWAAQMPKSAKRGA